MLVYNLFYDCIGPLPGRVSHQLRPKPFCMGCRSLEIGSWLISGQTLSIHSLFSCNFFCTWSFIHAGVAMFISIPKYQAEVQFPIWFNIFSFTDVYKKPFFLVMQHFLNSYLLQFALGYYYNWAIFWEIEGLRGVHLQFSLGCYYKLAFFLGSEGPRGYSPPSRKWKMTFVFYLN